jgi:16S rRNA (adenine1518-N6/adenine1519-N6)-dimethyltransferase
LYRPRIRGLLGGMKLTEMRALLDRHGIVLTKSLGQNFLHDAHQLERIVTAAGLTPQDKVLEIGPGLGPLTELLVARAGEVLAIEKDGRLVEVLAERFGAPVIAPSERTGSRFPRTISAFPPEPAQKGAPSNCQDAETTPPCRGGEGELLSYPPSSGFMGRAGSVPPPSLSGYGASPDARTSVLTVQHADALEVLKREPRDWSAWKLVANLPYSVASPILVELAAGARAPRLLVVTLQLEVAQRLLAQNTDDDYGILSLLVQLDFTSQGWFKIPPGCFFPAPEVDSACLCLARRERPLLAEDLRATFRQVVKRAFSQRRKMMLKLLKQDWPREKLEAAFATLKISPQERAEKLSLEQFVALTELLAQG